MFDDYRYPPTAEEFEQWIAPTCSFCGVSIGDQRKDHIILGVQSQIDKKACICELCAKAAKQMLIDHGVIKP